MITIEILPLKILNNSIQICVDIGILCTGREIVNIDQTFNFLFPSDCGALTAKTFNYDK